MKLTRLILCAPLALAACAEEADPGPGYDEALLAQYRSSLPSEDRLRMEDPQSAANAAGDAIYPNIMLPSVEGVNGLVVGIVTALDLLTSLPPTAYNSETKEFVWGPWDNDDGYGKMLAYIREKQEPNPDFRYEYALVRLVANDFATAQAVIYGGGTPGANEDEGFGITLWDFTGNDAWEAEHDPSYVPAAPHTTGRFLALYGAGSDAGASFKFNLAYFRHFTDANGGAVDANLDYYYGSWTGADSNNISFVDWQTQADLCDPGPACFDDKGTAANAAETLNIRLAFFNSGMGRAEATISDGSLTTPVQVEECWNQTIETSYLALTADGSSWIYPNPALDNEAAGCGSWFAQGLTAMGIPSLSDVDPALRAAMICVAEHGLGDPRCGG